MSSGPATVSPQRRSVGHRARRAARAASRRLSFSASSNPRVPPPGCPAAPEFRPMCDPSRGPATSGPHRPRVPDIGFHPGDHVGQRSRPARRPDPSTRADAGVPRPACPAPVESRARATSTAMPSGRSSAMPFVRDGRTWWSRFASETTAGSSGSGSPPASRKSSSAAGAAARRDRPGPAPVPGPPARPAPGPHASRRAHPVRPRRGLPRPRSPRRVLPPPLPSRW